MADEAPGETGKLMEEADSLMAQLKDDCTELSVVRRDFFAGNKSKETRQRMLQLESGVLRLQSELGEVARKLQQTAGIPEEVLKEFEQGELGGDSPNRIERSTLTADEVKPSALIDDILPDVLERLSGIPDSTWLREEREKGYRLDGDFLTSPLSLVRGIRSKSEFSSVHRFAQAIGVAEDYLADNQAYDMFAGALLVPQTTALGIKFDLLREVRGNVQDRIRALWKQPDTDSTVFELLVAAGGVERGRQMEFLLPGSEKTPDLRVHDYPFPTVVECKRKRALSEYELCEESLMRELFIRLHKAASSMGL